MRIVCLGCGPAGIYFAISMKLRDPSHELVVVERNESQNAFGWGVILSDDALANIELNDQVSAQAIREDLAYWDDIAVLRDAERVVSSGHGFAGIGCQKLLSTLQKRVCELGVELCLGAEFESAKAYSQSLDLVVAADGINSSVRDEYAEFFRPYMDIRECKFIWLGAHQKCVDAFTFIFENTKHGWVWAHAYQFDNGTATFIVECHQDTWDRWTFEFMSKEEMIQVCRKIYASHLGGHELISNAAHLRGSAVWMNFPRVMCGSWHHNNVVLMGDAAATGHFSIGSGTRLAFDSAISLTNYLHSEVTMEAAFSRCQGERRVEVLRLQSAARNSLEWFEQVGRYLDLDRVQFNYSLFTPFRLRGMTLKNRSVVSPMAQYKAMNGCPNDWHLVHYAERAKGGAGLVYTEMACISPEGRIIPGCPGLYLPEHELAWRRIAEFIHSETDAKICCQIGHFGRKGSTQIGWEEMGAPLVEGNWDILSASPIPWSYKNANPHEMTPDDMDQVCPQFVSAAQMASRAGFDMIELHAAHGYLISSFISPVSNVRSDEYGGSLQNRLRFSLEVFSAMRAVLPEHKPMSVRILANDLVGLCGVTPKEAVEIALQFKFAGADIIDVSAGQTCTEARPIYGRMFQTPFSDRIRSEAGIATMAVGSIYEADHANSILLAGREDLVAIGRPHLSDPYWTLHEVSRIGDRSELDWLLPYLAGRDQFWRLADREAETVRV